MTSIMGCNGEGQRENSSSAAKDAEVETAFPFPVVSPNPCKLQQFLQQACNFSEEAVNFAGKMKSYGTINSKSGTKQQHRDTRSMVLST